MKIDDWLDGLRHVIQVQNENIADLQKVINAQNQKIETLIGAIKDVADRVEKGVTHG